CLPVAAPGSAPTRCTSGHSHRRSSSPGGHCESVGGMDASTTLKTVFPGPSYTAIMSRMCALPPAPSRQASRSSLVKTRDGNSLAMLRAVTICAFWLSSIAPGLALDLYVGGTTGSDAPNHCQISATPCKTIPYAVNQVPLSSGVSSVIHVI